MRVEPVRVRGLLPSHGALYPGLGSCTLLRGSGYIAEYWGAVVVCLPQYSASAFLWKQLEPQTAHRQAGGYASPVDPVRTAGRGPRVRGLLPSHGALYPGLGSLSPSYGDP